MVLVTKAEIMKLDVCVCLGRLETLLMQALCENLEDGRLISGFCCG